MPKKTDVMCLCSLHCLLLTLCICSLLSFIGIVNFNFFLFQSELAEIKLHILHNKLYIRTKIEYEYIEIVRVSLCVCMCCVHGVKCELKFKHRVWRLQFKHTPQAKEPSNTLHSLFNRIRMNHN